MVIALILPIRPHPQTPFGKQGGMVVGVSVLWNESSNIFECHLFDEDLVNTGVLPNRQTDFAGFAAHRGKNVIEGAFVKVTRT